MGKGSGNYIGTEKVISSTQAPKSGRGPGREIEEGEARWVKRGTFFKKF